MNDDRLTQELQRRADSADSRPDWVRRDLLPAVRHEIDTRPQRVVTSNWSPRLGVAAVVAALLILVIAVPRLTPQPPAATASPSASPAPGPDTVLTMPEFAAGVASGQLIGRIVLVEGRISVPAIPEPADYPCHPPEGLCGLGAVDGTSPPIYVDDEYIATTDSPGSGTWAGGDGGRDYHFPSVPIEGVLALRPLSGNHAVFIGLVKQNAGRSVMSVAEARSVDVSTVTSDDAVLVRGWLIEPDAGSMYDCANPYPDLPGLPSRWCTTHSYLSSKPDRRTDRFNLSPPEGADYVRVQPGAANAFAVVDSEALYAISPRLYGGGCAGAPPCWQWSVVGRVNGPPLQPVTTGPTTVECKRSIGPLTTVSDTTGVVSDCRVLEDVSPSDQPMVFNPDENLSRLQVWFMVSRCINGADAQFSVRPGGYDLVITEGAPVPNCVGPRIGIGLDLNLRLDIGAAIVSATYSPQPAPTPSPPPSPTSEPVLRQIDCPVSADSGEPDLAPRVSAVDTTETVTRCAAFAGAPEYMVLPWAAPVIRNSSPTQLQVVWATTTCDHDVQLDVTQAGIRVQLTNKSCSDRTRLGQYVVLDFSQPVDAASLTGTITRASGSPDPNPPPSARPTGNPALVGQTLDCPYDQPLGGAAPSLIDHAGVIASCHTVLTSGVVSEQVQVMSDGDQLIVSWDAGPQCGSDPARLELWGPRYQSRGHTDRVLTDFDLWIDRPQEVECYGPSTTQQVVLDLAVPISSEEVNAFVTTGASSSDYAETPAAAFEFLLTADGSNFAANQAIDVQASLTYRGDPATITVSGASEYIVFGIEQLDGMFETSPLSALMFGEETLRSGVPDVRPFYKIGGFSNSDPEVERYRAYFDDPQLRLPPGTYRISAGVGFTIGAGTSYSQDGGVGLGTSIVIHVN